MYAAASSETASSDGLALGLRVRTGRSGDSAEFHPAVVVLTLEADRFSGAPSRRHATILQEPNAKSDGRPHIVA
jgi:hypothetical protein